MSTINRSRGTRIVLAGAYIVDKDELSVTYVSLGMLFPPLPRYNGEDLAELYAKLCKRHTLETFEMHGDEGATISTEGRYTIDLKRDRIIIEEDVKRRHFDLIKKDFADMVDVCRDHFNIRGFFEPKIEIRATWPIPNDGDALDAVRETAVGLRDDHFGLLENTEIEGVGLSIRALVPDGHLFLDVSPHPADPAQLAISAETWHHTDPLQSAAVIEARLGQAYDYFMDHITRFVSSFMP
jgi:hypothetical protein